MVTLFSERFSALVKRTCTRFGKLYVLRTRGELTEDEQNPTRPPACEWEEKVISGAVSSFYDREMANAPNILRGDKRFITPETNIPAGSFIVDEGVTYTVVATLTQHEVNGIVFAMEFQIRG